MPKKVKKSSKSRKNDDSKLFAFLATFLTIIGFLIAIIAKKDDAYVMFYAKQGLVLFIIQIIAAILSPIWFIGGLVWIAFLVFWIMAWINALSGEKRDTPLIGELAKKIKL